MNLLRFTVLLTTAFALFACGESGPRVVVYTALDPVFSREIFARFTAETGIRVDAVFDTEATKTTGLVERIRRESRRPSCDVFWNNEILRTIRLADEDLLERYESPSASDIPAEFKDAAGRWTGFAARARTVAFDPARTAADLVPRTHLALADARWRGEVAIANPQFGTTGSHLACLLAAWGEDRYRQFLESLAANDIRVVAGNATSRDMVISGEVALGLTDTDDVEVVRRRDASIDERRFPDEGTIVLPNTIALIRGAPNREPAERLIDFVLSETIEAELAASKSRQIPVRDSVPVPATGLRMAEIRRLDVSFAEAAKRLPDAIRIAREILR
ncbi:MAG: extracellular solute-binding protein [Planctomycetes bacterium]|nr:extracellular solute-binding protein [Planctomycetota bacterium]